MPKGSLKLSAKIQKQKMPTGARRQLGFCNVTIISLPDVVITKATVSTDNVGMFSILPATDEM